MAVKAFQFSGMHEVSVVRQWVFEASVIQHKFESFVSRWLLLEPGFPVTRFFCEWAMVTLTWSPICPQTPLMIIADVVQYAKQCNGQGISILLAHFRGIPKMVPYGRNPGHECPAILAGRRLGQTLCQILAPMPDINLMSYGWIPVSALHEGKNLRMRISDDGRYVCLVKEVAQSPLKANPLHVCTLPRCFADIYDFHMYNFSCRCITERVRAILRGMARRIVPTISSKNNWLVLQPGRDILVHVCPVFFDGRGNEMPLVSTKCW